MQITNDFQQFLTHILAGIVTIFEDPDLDIILQNNFFLIMTAYWQHDF